MDRLRGAWYTCSGCSCWASENTLRGAFSGYGEGSLPQQGLLLLCELLFCLLGVGGGLSRQLPSLREDLAQLQLLLLLLLQELLVLLLHDQLLQGLGALG